VELPASYGDPDIRQFVGAGKALDYHQAVIHLAVGGTILPASTAYGPHQSTQLDVLATTATASARWPSQSTASGRFKIPYTTLVDANCMEGHVGEMLKYHSVTECPAGLAGSDFWYRGGENHASWPMYEGGTRPHTGTCSHRSHQGSYA
jgi:hypothetical protein